MLSQTDTSILSQALRFGDFLHGLVSWLIFVKWVVVTLETHKTQISRVVFVM
jgi:hypothetical protein